MHESREPRTVLQHQFCRRLKAEREQKGISLHAIAEQSKVAVSHFTNLERGDISRWPTGIYRKQFFREYIRAIGLPPETLDEFQELFPEEPETGAPAESKIPAAPPAGRVTEGLRLALASEWRVRPSFSKTRAKAAAIDVVAVTLLAATASLVFQISLGTAAGSVAMLYFTTSTVLFGRSAASWQFSGGAAERRAQESPSPVADFEPITGERRSGSDRRRDDRRRPAEVAVLWHRLLSPRFRVRLGRRGNARPGAEAPQPRSAPWGKPGYVRQPGDTPH